MVRQVNRRQWMGSVTGLIVGLQCLPATLMADQARVTATHGYTIDMQSDGKLSLGEGEKKHVMPFHVTCQQEFAERLIIRDDIRLASRQYQVARLEKKFGNQEPEVISLPTDPTNILAFAESTDSGRMEFRSLDISLSQDQWNLLQTPLSPIWLDQLAKELMGQASRKTVGDKIKVSDALVSRLLCIESLETTNVICEVEKANDTQAVLKLTGEAEGRVLDAATKFKINASLRCLFETARITQLRASYVESREAGGIHPEFTASTKMKLDEAKPSAEIPSDTVRELVGLSQQAPVLTFSSDSNPVQLQHSNQWFLVMDRRGEITWRMIASGEALTQCKLLLLATKSESDVSLNDWVEVVNTAHKETGGEVVDTESLTGHDGGRIHRVEVHGKEGGADLAWIHYYISLPDGTRGEMAFTTDRDFVPALGGSDRLMAQSLQPVAVKVATAQ